MKDYEENDRDYQEIIKRMIENDRDYQENDRE
jgi:hypothetical protein